MEISAIMNIHELAVNRAVKQRSDAQAKKEQEVVQDNVLQPAQSDVKNKGLIEKTVKFLKKVVNPRKPQQYFLV